MLLKNLKINGQIVHKLPNSLFYFICIVYIILSGCKSDSTPAKVQTQQENFKQQTKNMNPEGFAFKHAKPSEIKNENITNKNNQKVPAIHPVSQIISKNKKDSEHNLIPVPNSGRNALPSTKLKIISQGTLGSK